MGASTARILASETALAAHAFHSHRGRLASIFYGLFVGGMGKPALHNWSCPLVGHPVSRIFSPFLFLPISIYAWRAFSDTRPSRISRCNVCLRVDDSQPGWATTRRGDSDARVGAVVSGCLRRAGGLCALLDLSWNPTGYHVGLRARLYNPTFPAALLARIPHRGGRHTRSESRRDPCVERGEVAIQRQVCVHFPAVEVYTACGGRRCGVTPPHGAYR